MKKIFTLIVFSSLVIGLFGQAEKQRLDSLVEQSYTTTSGWENDGKQIYTYDVAGNLVELIEYLDYSNGQPTYKYTYAYDTDGNRTSYMQYEWISSTTEWLNKHKHTYTHNAQGQLTEVITFKWEEDTEVWTPRLKYEYTFEDGNETVHSVYSWHIDDWIGDDRGEYIYDDNGIRVQDIHYRWEIDDWELFYRTEYTYNTDGSPLQDLGYRWFESTQTWGFWGKLDYTYDSLDNLILIEDFEWNGVEWINDDRTEYSYDNNENLSSHTYYRPWNTNTMQWEYGFKLEYNHDNAYSYDELIVPTDIQGLYYLDRGFLHKRTDYTEYWWDVSTLEWAMARKGTFYYSGQTVGITPAFQTNLLTFPNPTKNLLTFDLPNNYSATITLHDAQGKYIGAQNLQNNQLNVRHLDSGVYFYQLLNDGEMYGGKFIVK